MVRLIAAASVVSIMWLGTVPAFAQDTCSLQNGQAATVTGKIAFVDAAVPNKTYASYTADMDSPCSVGDLQVVDPVGDLRCQVGQEITAYGNVQVDDAGIFGSTYEVSTTNYSCR